MESGRRENPLPPLARLRINGMALAVVVVFGVFAFAPFSHAATLLNGFPSGAGGLMSLDKSPYIVTGDISVKNGNTLTIEPGVVVKMQAGRAIILQQGINGLSGTIVIGEEGNPNPVVITSYRDDAYGGDTNGDGDQTAPAPGDWKYIQASSDNAQLIIHNAIIRYGGFSNAMIQVLSGARGSIVSTTIEYSNNVGLAVRNGDSVLTLTDSAVQNNNLEGVTISFQADAEIIGTTFSNNRRGIAIDTDADVANLTISGNIFSNNTRVAGEIPFAGLDFDDADDTLIAIDNDWGDASGPEHADNPEGTGDRVFGNVTYNPWVGQVPSNQAPTLSYVGTGGYASDGVEPNISFKTQNLPIFQVVYSDPENDAPSYVKLVVATSALPVTFSMSPFIDGAYVYFSSLGTFAKGVHSYHFEASDGTTTVRLPASGELTFEVKNIPVVLVPGIMGTEMIKDSETVWPNISEMVTDSDDAFMNVLAMNPDGTFVDNQITLGDIVRNPPTKDIFTGLITELAVVGYQENIDLFVFPYDWRVDIRTSSEELKNKIDDVIAQTNSNTVNIVAHSMGGLLTKQYVLDNGSDLVDKLIFVGTPHLGAPKAAKTLLLGDDLGVRIIFRFLSTDRIKHISQNMPAIYQLLPSQLYVAQNGPYYYDFTTDAITFTYTELNDYFIGKGLNSGLIQDASSFHSITLDDFDATGIDAYNINGCTTPTISSITKKHVLVTEYSALMTAGDGTVPIESSMALDVEVGKAFYFNNIEHAEMPSADGIRELIRQIISGVDGLLPDNATQDSSECVIEGQLVSIHSPVNLHIYDSEGNHVGRGENGEIDYNISGVAYEEIGENKFVFLPSSGGQSYRIELDGTGEGTFSLRVSKVEDNQVTETAYYSNLPVNTATEATVTLASSVSGTVLEIDQIGTGNFVETPVSAVLDSAQSADVTKPTSIISVSGGENSAAITFSATDDNAGILKIEYSLDGGTTWQTYANSFILNTIGTTAIQYRAQDRAGNVETAKSETVRIMPAAVVIPPSTPSASRHPELVSGSDPEPEIHFEPEVLGEQQERPRNEQYTTEDILQSLAQANLDILLDYLGATRNLALEQSIAERYTNFDTPSVNFVAYGTKGTQVLGAGERAGVLYSYLEAFGSLPKTPDDWQDVVNIATNQMPNRRSVAAEQKARDAGASDEKSIMMIAYGLRPENRDLVLEQEGLASFVQDYGRLPGSTLDWNILRSIVY